MKKKSAPFTEDTVRSLERTYPTPFYVYDEAGVRASARALIDAFAWIRDSKNISP